jgi:putative ABC transport system substrate-binding protein
MRRREFITFVGGAAATWPLSARGQQPERVRRIGVLSNLSAKDPTGQQFVGAFRKRLQELGWVDGRNAGIEIRWAAGDDALHHTFATELVAQAPDVILASTTAAVLALKRVTPIIPIVFAGVIDPVGSGLVTSLARPGGNATGFVQFEYAIAAKWLDLIREIAPGVSRVAVLRDAAIASGIGQFAAVQTVAPVNIELSAIGLQDTAEIEHSLATFARGSNGGMIVTAALYTVNHSNLLVASAARYKLPAVYPFRRFVSDGGLASYGPDGVEPYRQAADYVDRILKGERPSDLPVQAPTKYELVINLKTAKALGLGIPAALLARADEVIE